jgi:predicted nuclease with TOPRIM domain
MTNTPIQISTDLKEYLDKFDQKLDRMDAKWEQKFEKIDVKFEKMDAKFNKLQEEVTNIRIELVATQGSIKTLEVEVQNVKKKVDEIDTVQKTLVESVSDLKGVKSLIIPALIAVLPSSLTFFYRFIPIP